MSFKKFLNTLTLSITSAIATGAILLPQPYQTLLIIKISTGLMLIDLLIEPLMHFFTFKKYFLNQVLVTFILYFGTLLFFAFIAFPGSIGHTMPDIFKYVFMWALFSSIIRNIMYYTR